MAAKGMFKELGYKCEEYDDFIIYKDIRNNLVKYEIVFNKYERCAELIPTCNGEVHYFVRLDRDLHKAINQQCKELGWF